MKEIPLIDECKERYFISKRVKDILHDVEKSKGRFKRTLGVFDITTLGIGAIIGAGIFVLTGTAAARHGGPAIVLSFVISGIACAFAALCYAEFASMIPVAGSAYTYSYVTMGELVAWIIGWDLILEYSLGGVAVSIGWSGYFVNLLAGVGINVPVWMSGAPGSVPGAIINIPAMMIVLLLTAVLIVGVKESARFNNVMVAIKLTVVVFFICVGMFFIAPANWSPFVPFGWGGIMTGAAIVFFAYIGFDAVSTTAEEAKNPQRDLPRGIIASLVVCTILYVLVALVLTGIISYTELDVPHPLALAFNKILPGASLIISIGAIAGITSVLLVGLLAQPRIFFSLSRDGLLPKQFSKIHPKFKTPYIPTMITGLIVALFAGFLPIGTAAELVNIGTLFAFLLVCLGIPILRKTQPNAKRPFKCPLVPIIPLLGVLFCIYLMMSLPLLTWLRFFVWFGIGLVIYSSYGYSNSELAKKLRRRKK